MMWYLVLRDNSVNRTLKVVEVKTQELALLTHQKFYSSTRRDPKYLLQLHEARSHEELFFKFPQYSDARSG